MRSQLFIDNEWRDAAATMEVVNPATEDVIVRVGSAEQKDVAKEPKPLVYFSDFADTGMKFELAFWIDGVVGQDMGMIKSDIRYRMEELFAREGIALAYRQQDVHLDGELKLVQSGPSA